MNNTIPMLITNVDRNEGIVRLCMKQAHPIPESLGEHTTVYLSTTPPPQPRTSDMQDLVDRCEAKHNKSVGWYFCERNDGIYLIVDKDGDTVAMIPASWWLKGETDQERADELRMLREKFFVNRQLLVNAERMFDLLVRIDEDNCVFSNTLDNELKAMLHEIRTKQWRAPQPAQG